jgi:hypothetical protein
LILRTRRVGKKADNQHSAHVSYRVSDSEHINASKSLDAVELRGDSESGEYSSLTLRAKTRVQALPNV